MKHKPKRIPLLLHLLLALNSMKKDKCKVANTDIKPEKATGLGLPLLPNWGIEDLKNQRRILLVRYWSYFIANE